MRPRVPEADLQSAVIDLARFHGCIVAHFRAARTAKGWATPVAADGKGFPDLVIVGTGVLYRELKSDRGYLSREQQAWLCALTAAGQDADVWRPADLHNGRIPTELARLAGRVVAS